MEKTKPQHFGFQDIIFMNIEKLQIQYYELN